MSERGLCHEIEDLGGGVHRSTIYGRPINYDAGSGLMLPIPRRLELSGDADRPIGLDAPGYARVAIRARTDGLKPLVHVGRGSDYVRLSPVDVKDVAATVAEGSVSFLEAWPASDLRFDWTGHSLRKTIALRSGHKRSFSFRVDSPSMDWRTMRAGPVAIAQPVLTRDEKMVPLEWEHNVVGGRHLLTVRLPEGDWSWWDLDPTLTLQPSGTTGLDALISNSSPTTNYATATTGGVYADGTYEYRFLLQFTLTSLPADALIASAILTMYSGADNGTGNVGVHLLKRSWVEAQVTWTISATGTNWTELGAFHVDDCEQTPIGQCLIQQPPNNSGYRNFNLDAQVKADLGSYGWLLKFIDGSGMRSSLFYTSDNTATTQRPKLVVVYNEASTSAAIVGVGGYLTEASATASAPTASATTAIDGVDDGATAATATAASPDSTGTSAAGGIVGAIGATASHTYTAAASASVSGEVGSISSSATAVQPEASASSAISGIGSASLAATTSAIYTSAASTSITGLVGAIASTASFEVYTASAVSAIAPASSAVASTADALPPEIDASSSLVAQPSSVTASATAAAASISGEGALVGEVGAAAASASFEAYVAAAIASVAPASAVSASAGGSEQPIASASTSLELGTPATTSATAGAVQPNSVATGELSPSQPAELLVIAGHVPPESLASVAVAAVGAGALAGVATYQALALGLVELDGPGAAEIAAACIAEYAAIWPCRVEVGTVVVAQSVGAGRPSMVAGAASVPGVEAGVVVAGG